jgi:hypothetical protein
MSTIYFLFYIYINLHCIFFFALMCVIKNKCNLLFEILITFYVLYTDGSNYIYIHALFILHNIYIL